MSILRLLLEYNQDRLLEMAKVYRLSTGWYLKSSLVLFNIIIFYNLTDSIYTSVYELYAYMSYI